MAKPANCITETEARQLHDNWVATREPVITQMRNGVQDTREFVFSVTELEEFLDYVKTLSKKGGFNDPGVRIYFGAYDNNNSDRATVFLSPTEDPAVDSENNYSIESLNFVGGGWPPKVY